MVVAVMVVVVVVVLVVVLVEAVLVSIMNIRVPCKGGGGASTKDIRQGPVRHYLEGDGPS